MTTPIVITSDDIRSMSQLDYPALNYGPVTSGTDLLDREVRRSIGYVQMVTGQDATLLDDATDLGVAFEQAVQLRVEQQVIQRQPDFVSDLNENAINFNVTGYAQTRVDAKQQNPSDMINPWPELNALLVLLLTDDKYDYWVNLGKVPVAMINAPYEDVSDIAWQRFGVFDNFFLHPLRPTGNDSAFGEY